MIISIYIDFICFYFPFVSIHWLMGYNILSGIVGGLTNQLLQPLLDALNNVVIKPLNIRLPGLNLNNIQLEGSWDATYVSDGTIAPSVTQ